MDVQNLSCEAVNLRSQHYVWSEHPKEWRPILPYTIDEIEESEEICLDDYYPAISYYYPLPEGLYDKRDAQKLEGLPVMLVRFCQESKDCFALVLTGGGMDLSWEIVEAYIRLGFLPPVEFCDLPNMAGYKEHRANYYDIVEACERAIEVTERNLGIRKKQLAEMKN